jgi:hypothetical protein
MLLSGHQFERWHTDDHFPANVNCERMCKMQLSFGYRLFSMQYDGSNTDRIACDTKFATAVM